MTDKFLYEELDAVSKMGFLKEEFRNSDFYRSALIYFNERIKNDLITSMSVRFRAWV